jgi:hypothetical protein
MDINHIQLPFKVIADLYQSSLVETGEITGIQPDKFVPLENKTETVQQTQPGWKSLGENKKNILIIVDYPDAVHIPDNELQFLTNILSACKLSLADVAIVNTNKQPGLYKELLDAFRTRITILFDMEPAKFGLPMNFPYFQIQPFANCSFLYAPSLKELEEDKVQKSKLWVSLRRLFNI